jgi:hypothetical protein
LSFAALCAAVQILPLIPAFSPHDFFASNLGAGVEKEFFGGIPFNALILNVFCCVEVLNGRIN